MTGSATLDSVGAAAEELRKQKAEEAKFDDYIMMGEPAAMGEFINQRTAAEDSGAGVFGGLQHIKVRNANTKSKEEMAFTDPDWTQDDGDLPPDWSINRRKLEAELEHEFVTTPFETYELVRGKTGKAGKLFGNTIKTVGKMKALIRVMETEDEAPLLSAAMMDQLMKPKPYVVRLYVLKVSIGFRPKIGQLNKLNFRSLGLGLG